MSLNSHFHFLILMDWEHLKLIPLARPRSLSDFSMFFFPLCVLFLITQVVTYWLCTLRSSFIWFSLSVSSPLGNGNTLVCQFYRYDSPGGDALRRKINMCSQFPNFSNAKSDTDGVSYHTWGVKVILLSHSCDFMFFRVCHKGMIMPSFPSIEFPCHHAWIFQFSLF